MKRSDDPSPTHQLTHNTPCFHTNTPVYLFTAETKKKGEEEEQPQITTRQTTVHHNPWTWLPWFQGHLIVPKTRVATNECEKERKKMNSNQTQHSPEFTRNGVALTWSLACSPLRRRLYNSRTLKLPRIVGTSSTLSRIRVWDRNAKREKGISELRVEENVRKKKSDFSLSSLLGMASSDTDTLARTGGRKGSD